MKPIALKGLYKRCSDAAVDKYPLVTLLATADTLATHLIEGRR